MVPVLVVEGSCGVIIPSRFQSYSFGAGYSSGGFQPQKEGASKALPLTLWPHGKQYEMSVVFPVLHDSKGIDFVMLAHDRHICVRGCDRSSDPFRAPRPWKALLNEVA